MEMLDSLPSRPLNRADVGQLRTRDSVNGFIKLPSNRDPMRNGGLEKATVLIDHTVVRLAFENEAWEQTVLAHDADDQDHLHETLDQLDED
jgi:hypothetical protein